MKKEECKGIILAVICNCQLNGIPLKNVIDREGSGEGR